MLNDLLHLTDEEIRRTKIRCCTEYNRYNPAEEFKKNPDMFNTEWILSRKKNKDGRGAEHLYRGWNVIGLARLPIDKDLWVLTCIKRISNTLDRPEEDNGAKHYVGYEGEELTEYRKFCGRVIVCYQKVQGEAQPIYLAGNLLDELPVEKILPPKGLSAVTQLP